jgi:predicted MFS family arabinose efflux permease
VMPLGPDFAAELGIPSSALGWVGGSYTAAASVSGLLGSLFLDRFSRRKALFWAMLGLALGTVAGGFATSLTTLMIARVVAGAFGGPATSLILSLVADVVPPARRGRAMGAVMGAFSLASIAGVPVGLELARMGGWRTPFFVVGILAMVVTLAAIRALPATVAATKGSAKQAFMAAAGLLKRPEVLCSYAAISLAMMGAFMLIPNFSAYFQHNLGFPREKLGLLYFGGGLLSFFAMRLAGRIIDRYSAFVVANFATALFIGIVFSGYFMFPPLLPSYVLFTGFMMAMSIRGVAVGSLSSRVPRPHERAGYMSFQSAVQHFASSLGAILSTWILSEESSGALTGMPTLSLLAIGLSVTIPAFLRQVEGRVRRNEGRSDLSPPPEAVGAPHA